MFWQAHKPVDIHFYILIIFFFQLMVLAYSSVFFLNNNNNNLTLTKPNHQQEGSCSSTKEQRYDTCLKNTHFLRHRKLNMSLLQVWQNGRLCPISFSMILCTLPILQNVYKLVCFKRILTRPKSSSSDSRAVWCFVVQARPSLRTGRIHAFWSTGLIHPCNQSVWRDPFPKAWERKPRLRYCNLHMAQEVYMISANIYNS